MILKKKFIILLLFGLVLGVLLSFSFQFMLKNINKSMDLVFENNFSKIREILSLNINFLKARRAEKNLIIFKSFEYKDEIDSYLRQIDTQIKNLEFLKLDARDEEMLSAVKKNVSDYRMLLSQLMPVVIEKGADSDELKIITDRLKVLNDTFAENIMLFYTKNSGDIIKGRQKIELYLSGLANFVAVLPVLAIGLGYAVAVYLRKMDFEQMFK